MLAYVNKVWTTFREDKLKCQEKWILKKDQRERRKSQKPRERERKRERDKEKKKEWKKERKKVCVCHSYHLLLLLEPQWCIQTTT
jgi:hypothetical protein